MSRHPWPVTITTERVTLRPLRYRDEPEYRQLRMRNQLWTGPWDATLPPGSVESLPSFWQLIRQYNREARTGRSLPWAISYTEDDGRSRLVGQMNMSGITYGAASWVMAGYWVDRGHAGRGIVPLALAMATDYCFFTHGLHRVEVAIRPENVASLRVVHKLGFRYEGERPNYMHVAGAWRDHQIFALHADEVGSGLIARFLGGKATLR